MLNKIVKKIKRKENRLNTLVSKGLIIGEKSKITCYSPEGIDGVFPWLIEIGDSVIISTDCRVMAHDASLANLIGYSKVGRVIIEDNVYIGNGCTILPGVTIGENSVVGANSLVNKSLPPNGVYVGNPAKRICSIEDFINKHKVKIESGEFPVFENNFLYYQNASNDEKIKMKDSITNGIGYIKSRKL